jgi:hypothetical protein
MPARGRATKGYDRLARGLCLTCTNRAGHGWWLGRYKGYRLF